MKVLVLAVLKSDRDNKPTQPKFEKQDKKQTLKEDEKSMLGKRPKRSDELLHQVSDKLKGIQKKDQYKSHKKQNPQL